MFSPKRASFSAVVTSIYFLDNTVIISSSLPKRILNDLKKKPLTKKLVGLDIQGDKPAIGSVLYDKNRKEIGIVTAGMWSPSLKSNIAFGYVDNDHMKIGSKVFAEIYHPEELEYKKIWAGCLVVKKQFFNPQRRHKVPADI